MLNIHPHSHHTINLPLVAVNNDVQTDVDISLMTDITILIRDGQNANANEIVRKKLSTSADVTAAGNILTINLTPTDTGKLRVGNTYYLQVEIEDDSNQFAYSNLATINTNKQLYAAQS